MSDDNTNESEDQDVDEEELEDEEDQEDNEDSDDDGDEEDDSELISTRARLKKANAEAKKRRLALRAAEKKIKELEGAGEEDDDALTAAEARELAMTKRLARLELRDAIVTSAGKKKLAFVNPQAAKDAASFLTEDLEFDLEDGYDADEVTDAVVQLKKDRPYLFDSKKAKSTDANNRGEGTFQISDEDLEAAATEFGVK